MGCTQIQQLMVLQNKAKMESIIKTLESSKHAKQYEQIKTYMERLKQTEGNIHGNFSLEKNTKLLSQGILNRRVFKNQLHPFTIFRSPNSFRKTWINFINTMKILKALSRNFIQKSIKNSYSKVAVTIQRAWRKKYRNAKIKR